MLSRHPLALVTREVPAVPLDSRGTVLILQDLHSPFSEPERGWLAREAGRKIVYREFEEYFEMLPSVVANASRLLTAARAHGLAIHYACLGHRNGEQPSALQRAMGWEWDVDGPAGRFPEGIEPMRDETVHVKPGWGLLTSSSARTALRTLDATTVLLAGVPFDFGIRHTCFELADAGYRTLVVSDATAAITRSAEGPTRGNLAHGTTKLRSTAETLDLITRLAKESRVLV